MTGGRSFFDTNVLIYTVDATAPVKQARAIELLGETAAAANGMISTQVLQEFYNTITRKLNVPPSSAARIARRFGQFRTIGMTSEIVFAAMDRHTRGGVSFWDALIVEAAIAGGADTLYSEDMHDGLVVDRLTICNPFLAAGA